MVESSRHPGLKRDGRNVAVPSGPYACRRPGLRNIESVARQRRSSFLFGLFLAAMTAANRLLVLGTTLAANALTSTPIWYPDPLGSTWTERVRPPSPGPVQVTVTPPAPLRPEEIPSGTALQLPRVRTPGNDPFELAPTALVRSWPSRPSRQPPHTIYLGFGLGSCPITPAPAPAQQEEHTSSCRYGSSLGL